MSKGLDEGFGVLLSFAVIVMDMELFESSVFGTGGQV
jgi:hypothetical protein